VAAEAPLPDCVGDLGWTVGTGSDGVFGLVYDETLFGG